MIRCCCWVVRGVGQLHRNVVVGLFFCSLLPAWNAWTLPNVMGSAVQDVAAGEAGGTQQDAVAEPGETPVFSGPQVDEALPSFVFRELLVAEAAEEIDLVARAAGRPLLLVFVHEVNRPSIGFTRMLTGYGHSRASDGLTTGVVFLPEDVTAGEAEVQRIRHALTPGVPTGVALEGREGPGSLGLNRHVSLTILLAREGKVLANFALVQPSLQVDLPRVLEPLAKMLGGPVPTLADLETLSGQAPMAGRGGPAAPGAAAAPNLRPLLSPLIRRDATEEAVQRAAEAVEQAAAKDEAVRKEVHRIATTIVRAGVVENYGTPAAQAYLRKWAAEAEGGQEPEPSSR